MTPRAFTPIDPVEPKITILRSFEFFGAGVKDARVCLSASLITSYISSFPFIHYSSFPADTGGEPSSIKHTPLGPLPSTAGDDGRGRNQPQGPSPTAADDGPVNVSRKPSNSNRTGPSK